MNGKAFFIHHLTKVLLFVWFVSSAFSLSAQSRKTSFTESRNSQPSTVEIVGKIIDRDTKKPLEFSTISVYSKNDSLIVAGTIANADGRFYLVTGHRDFLIKIDFLSYQTLIFGDTGFPEDTPRIDLGVVELIPVVAQIEEVEVLAGKSTVMMTLDKRVFNVEKDLTSIGGTAEDVIRNVPGISVDSDGKFKLRGNGNIRFLLNGRPSSLLSPDNISGFRQIRANQIELVEIITNPSSRYEAEGMSGVVNIVLKTYQGRGVNGAVDTYVGNNHNKGLGGNINFNAGKMQGYLGLGVWRVNRPGTGSFRNRFYHAEDPDSTLFSYMDRTHERNTFPGFVKMGADYAIGPKHNLSTSFAYRRSTGTNTSDLKYKDALGEPGEVFLITERQEDEEEIESDLLYGMVYKKTFSGEGHQLVSEIQYEDKASVKTSVFEEDYFDALQVPLPRNEYLQFAEADIGNRRLGVNLDYTLPLRKEGKFEAGWQSSFRKIFNNYRVSEVVNNIEVTDVNFTNDFLYREHIHGLYFNYRRSINKFTLQAGMRMEHSYVTTELLATNEIIPRTYTNLFPGFFLTYNLAGDHALQFSYNRRIRRPASPDLNPFFTIRDRRNIFRGNPAIQPEYTDAFELGFIHYREKATLSSVAYYRMTDRVIKRLQRIDSNMPGVTITQAENLDFKRNYGVELTYSYFPSQRWWLNGDVNIFHSHAEGTFMHEGKAVFVGGASFSMIAKTSTRVTIWENVHTQLTLGYTAPRTTTQGVNRATTAVDVAMGMDFLKKNGTLTISINDVFNSRRRRSYSEDETFFSEDNFLWFSRTMLLSFHYRINQQKESQRVYVNPLRGEGEVGY